VNDDCANAIPLAAGSPAACGSTVCATPSLPGTIPVPCGSSANSPDVWYTFTPQCNGQVTIDTCGYCTNQSSVFDTVLSVYSGQCGSMTKIACNDDYTTLGFIHPCRHQSRVRFDGIAGVTYYIRVAGFSGESGPFRLNISQSATPPPNDLCANATVIKNGTYAFNNCGANTDGPSGSCQPNQDVWFRYTAPCSGQVWLDTCRSGFDTVMAVYSGTCGNLSLIDCNDNVAAGRCIGSQYSFVSFNATADTTYSIRVGGAGAATGWGRLTVQGPYPALGTCIATANPKFGRAFQIMGPPNNTPWSWSISVDCCINIGNINVPGVSSGDANTLAVAFANSINSACPDGGVTAAAYPGNPNISGLMVVDVSSCTGVLTPFILRVGSAGAAEEDQCVVADVNGNDPLPTTGPCSFNPEIIELPLSGQDCNTNQMDDAIDIMTGSSADVNGNGIPDECESCLPPEFTSKADPQVVQIGQTAILTVAGSGTAPLEYQWNFAGVPLNDGGPISGSHSNSLTIQNVAFTNLGDYSVTVSNACGAATSVPVALSTETVTAPIIVSLESVKGSFKFAFVAKQGQTYVVEYKNNLTDTSWTPMETVVGEGIEHRVLDVGPLPMARFYRVRVSTP